MLESERQTGKEREGEGKWQVGGELKGGKGKRYMEMTIEARREEEWRGNERKGKEREGKFQVKKLEDKTKWGRDKKQD